MKNILIDFVWLFCSLLADASNKPFAAILQQPSLSPHLESLSVLLSASKKHPHPPSFLVLKDQLYSKLKLITRNFRSTHNHMRCELAAIDKTSLQQLHYNLLQFFASSLAGGNWVYWEI